jgi:hypothetical protein
MSIEVDKHYIVWDHDAAPIVLYEVCDLIDLVLQAQPHKWETQFTAAPGDVALIGITESLSPVNAGIIFFCRPSQKRSSPYVQLDPNADPEMLVEASMRRLQKRREHHGERP